MCFFESHLQDQFEVEEKLHKTPPCFAMCVRRFDEMSAVVAAGPLLPTILITGTMAQHPSKLVSRRQAMAPRIPRPGVLVTQLLSVVTDSICPRVRTSANSTPAFEKQLQRCPLTAAVSPFTTKVSPQIHRIQFSVFASK